MTRIVCVGNRLVVEDSAGPRVFDRLAREALPDGVELFDGGLAGLDLLVLFEGADHVVLVDRVVGVGRTGEVVVIERAEAAATALPRCDHAGGLGYLLRCLPAVCRGAVPRLTLVGVEAGEPDDRVVEQAASCALSLAVRAARAEAKAS